MHRVKAHGIVHVVLNLGSDARDLYTDVLTGNCKATKLTLLVTN